MKNKKCKIISIICVCVLLILSVNFNTTAKAATSEENDNEIARYTIEVHEYPSNSDGAGLARATNSKTASKTIRSENAAGNPLWEITVTATFYYNGATSVCSQVSASTKSYSSAWSVGSPSYGKSGNSAWATATATCSSLKKTDTQTASLWCSRTGEIHY